MAMRHKIAPSKSKKQFRKSADLTHKKNMPKRLPMRGGIRLDDARLWTPMALELIAWAHGESVH